MADGFLNPSLPPYLHLLSSFLAMEPPDSLISHARVCGRGEITKPVQQFIWDNCLSKDCGIYGPYLKSFMKKLISEVELNRGDVLDQLYEQYARYMTSLKDAGLVKGRERIYKRISFIYPDGSSEQPSPHSSAMVVTLQCSLNMLEGDTGCSIWPSSLFLSEFILSFPELFSTKSCFEVGSGVGLVGICLAHVKASEVLLSDGDLSTLANMKFNLELNHMSVESEDQDLVKCIYLPWESASESELDNIVPDVILGADVIYDPVCIPHLVRVLTILLKRSKPLSPKQNGLGLDFIPGNNCYDCKLSKANESNISDSFRSDRSGAETSCIETTNPGSRNKPVAYIACVIRNIDTFDKFLILVHEAKLNITDLSDMVKPKNFLPYMQSYDQASVKLLCVSDM